MNVILFLEAFKVGLNRNVMSHCLVVQKGCYKVHNLNGMLVTHVTCNAAAGVVMRPLGGNGLTAHLGILMDLAKYLVKEALREQYC